MEHFPLHKRLGSSTAPKMCTQLLAEEPSYVFNKDWQAYILIGLFAVCYFGTASYFYS